MKRASAPFYAVLDVGTTAIKAILLDTSFNIIVRVSVENHSSHPKRGWVEQDPLAIVRASRDMIRKAFKKSGYAPSDCLGMGITNQRETTIGWNKQTGKPVYPAIVWQDNRTAKFCASFKKNRKDLVHARTGLVLESYFSASKMHWISKQPKAQALRETGDLVFGTVDSWVLWNLTEEHAFLTDETNASRTLLYNIQKHRWDEELLATFELSTDLLPSVRPSRSHFGTLALSVLGSPIPIVAMCGDQQSSFYAATQIARNHPRAPLTKVTFGTGTFVNQALRTYKRYPGFYTTLAPSPEGTTYLLETVVPHGGREVEKVLHQPKKLNALLQLIAKNVDERLKDLPTFPKELIIDGGVTRDGLLAEWQSIASDIPVITPPLFDGTALGTAYLCRDMCPFE